MVNSIFILLFLVFFVLYRAYYAQTACPFATPSANQCGGFLGMTPSFPTSIGQTSSPSQSSSSSSSSPSSQSQSPSNQSSQSSPPSSTPVISVDPNAKVAAAKQSACDATRSCNGQAFKHPFPEDTSGSVDYLSEATCSGSCGDDIRNPAYPTKELPCSDPQTNVIREQRRLLREYQSYIKHLRGSCCSRIHAGTNLLDNPLSNKNYEVRPMIASGGDGAMNIMADDFSNIMTISPKDAEKYKVSFYDQEPVPARTFALQASENFPMYQRTFDRSFVSRIPDPPNLAPFKVNPWMDWPGSDSYCPASKACQGSFSPPWSTNKSFSCPGMNFEHPRAPEPQNFACSRIGQPSPLPGTAGYPKSGSGSSSSAGPTSTSAGPSGQSTSAGPTSTSAGPSGQSTSAGSASPTAPAPASSGSTSASGVTTTPGASVNPPSQSTTSRSSPLGNQPSSSSPTTSPAGGFFTGRPKSQ